MCVDPNIWSVESVAYLLHTMTGNTWTVWTSFCTWENYIPPIFLLYFFKIGLISPKLASRDDLELMIFLHPLPKCWHCRCALTHKVSSISENQDKDLEYGRQALHTATTPGSPRNFNHAVVMLWSGILFWDVLPNYWMTCFLENIPRSVSSYNSASKLITWALLPTCSSFINQMKRKNKIIALNDWGSIDWLVSSF